MRMAIPLETWLRMREWGESARSESISTPRLIGPGCMMTAFGFSQDARRALRPNMLVYSPREGKWVELWRSCWMRRRIMASASLRACWRLCEIETPNWEKVWGTRVEGPARVTWAPSFWRAQMLERATRLKRMSPKIVIFLFLRSFVLKCSMSVKQSRRAWVGCSCAPSPALITGILTILLMKEAAPAKEWRMTMALALRAWILRAVSWRDSPLERLLALSSMVMTLAPRFLAATSKATRVRVLGSRKRLTIVFPWRDVGFFEELFSKVFLKSEAVEKSVRISSFESSSMLSRSFLVQ